MEEEAEPDALAAALAPDPVHAVVPVARAHQRQAVRALGQRAVERAAAMLVQAGALARVLGQEERLVLAVGELPGVQETHHLVENRAIAACSRT